MSRVLRYALIVLATGSPLAPGVFASAPQEPDAREIVRQANELARGLNSLTTASMQIVRPDWTREMAMKSWSLGTDYYMILITAPARDQGQVFLKRENDMWNWVPRVQRSVKIPPSMMNQSWMGSDFTNNDLVRIDSLVIDYEQSILGEETIEGYETWQIELMPLPEAPVVWGRVVLWIAKDELFMLRAEYFDEDGELINRQTGSEVKMMDDRLIPTRLVMEDAKKPGHMTIMVTEAADFSYEVSESFFSQQQMRNVR
ncbi:MAG: outer membrane lipoprotein-sorting protein [Acidobacteria bacterium]|nr:outer membrane lipoprotein-sorting protein [Acidobacteriota bacterium]